MLYICHECFNPISYYYGTTDGFYYFYNFSIIVDFDKGRKN